MKKAEESRRQDAQVTYDKSKVKKKKKNKDGEEISEYEDEVEAEEADKQAK